MAVRGPPFQLLPWNPRDTGQWPRCLVGTSGSPARPRLAARRPAGRSPRRPSLDVQLRRPGPGFRSSRGHHAAARPRPVSAEGPGPGSVPQPSQGGSQGLAVPSPPLRAGASVPRGDGPGGRDSDPGPLMGSIVPPPRGAASATRDLGSRGHTARGTTQAGPSRRADAAGGARQAGPRGPRAPAAGGSGPGPALEAARPPGTPAPLACVRAAGRSRGPAPRGWEEPSVVWGRV